MVKWNKYFDKVYCLHYLPQADRLPRLQEELARVGLSQSGILEMRYNSPCEYDKLIFEKFQNKALAPSLGFVNIALEVRKVLTEAKAFGYKRILLLENDVAFLRNLGKLEAYLAQTPKGFGIVQYDKFVVPRFKAQYDNLIVSAKIGGSDNYFESPHNMMWTSAACIGLFDDGITQMLDILNKQIVATDITYQMMTCRYAVAIQNLAIQVTFADSQNVHNDDSRDMMDSVYKNQNIDYSLYAVPKGYGYGVFYDPKSAPCTASHSPISATAIEILSDSAPYVCKGRKHVSVYAIAKNEAKFVRRWFECVKEADEVCVLDTGSTDETVEILKSLGAKVYRRIYTPFNFAAARNDSMSLVHPKAEILFCMDIDETIKPGWRAILEEKWIAAEKANFNPTVAKYREALNFNEDGSYKEVFQQLKIHKKGSAHWVRPIHECLEFSPFRPVEVQELVVEHHPDPLKDRDIYITMLQDSLKSPDADIRSYYYLGQEFLRRNKNKEAAENFYSYITKPGTYLPVERCVAMVGLAKAFDGQGDRASSELWLWRASAEDPANREPLYWLGIYAYNRKDYKSAVSILNKCISIKEEKFLYHKETLAYNESPRKYLADALWCLGRYVDAILVAKKNLELFPDSEITKAQVEGMQKDRASQG